MLTAAEFSAIRRAIATIPADVSNDAVGSQAAKLDDIYAPEAHASALDPTIPIVVGARGAGKSFWSSVLGQEETRGAAALAYPRLGLKNVLVEFGFTGAVSGARGISNEALNAYVKEDATPEEAKCFWWGTIIRAAAVSLGQSMRLAEAVREAQEWESREELISEFEARLRKRGKALLVVYDALDTVATSWPRRRFLTEALLEVVWAMRAYESINVKLFIRPDQIDDAYRFVEVSKLRTGAVRLRWENTDLYGLLFSRVMLSPAQDATLGFAKLLKDQGIAPARRNQILARKWELAYDPEQQGKAMSKLAGPFMADGPHGYKKGRTYEWPLKHLGDAFQEVTPRSFLGLMIGAAKHGPTPTDRSITADGIRHGLRAASKTRVDQLHTEFLWIKGVLAPLAGLLLPQFEDEVFKVWQRAKTIRLIQKDARETNYLPPFPLNKDASERDLFDALERIGVMFRRKDDRLDMPDLFRVAAKLLKKGGTTPI